MATSIEIQSYFFPPPSSVGRKMVQNVYVSLINYIDLRQSIIKFSRPFEIYDIDSLPEHISFLADYNRQLNFLKYGMN